MIILLSTEIIKSKSNPPTLNREVFFTDKLEILMPGFLLKNCLI